MPTTFAILLSFAFGAPAPQAAPATAPEHRDSSYPLLTTQSKETAGIKLTVHSFELDNGLRVHIVEDHSSPTLAIRTVFAVGSRDEPSGRTGFANLIEHMMSAGSANVPAGAHSRYIAAAGGRDGGFTRKEHTQYYAELASNYLDRILWLEADRLRALDFSAERFEHQRAAVSEELVDARDNQPYIGALLGFTSAAFADTGYGHDPYGAQADLDAAELSEVRAFFDQYYTPQNAVLSIVGDVDPNTVLRTVQQYYGSIARGQARPSPPQVPTAAGSFAKTVEDKHAKLPLLAFAWPTVARTHNDRPALELLICLLARGDSSRLRARLVHRDRLAVKLFRFDSGEELVGLDTIAVIPTPNTSPEQVYQAVREELGSIRSKGVSARELEKAKNGITLDTVQKLATNDGRARAIATSAVLHNDPLFVLTQLERSLAVTGEDIIRVANTYLTDDWMTLEIKP